MAKLSKAQLKAHSQAMEILATDKPLSGQDKWFVMENWRPTASKVTGSDAFFTPMPIAMNLAMSTYDEGHILDLCAGIGRLSFAMLERARYWPRLRITALEMNPEFVEVGRKVLPEVEWITGDMLDENLWEGLGPFTAVVSNPPFGNTKAKPKWLKYHGKLSLMAAEIAVRKTLERSGTFIFPQSICPFRYSGVREYTEIPKKRMDRETLKFMDLYPEVEWRVSSFDVSHTEFDETDIPVEIVNLEGGEPNPLRGLPLFEVINESLL
ncbi:MAG TPA: methyltransferase [Bellilinea sp.]|nr:methyltransferase [Bellilinea sp.]